MKFDILIADDHDLILSGIEKQILQDYKNAKITKVNDGCLALKVLETNHIDILITDINMPKLNGLQLIKKAKNIQPKIKIIVLTYIEQNAVFKKIVKLDVNALVLKTDSINAITDALKDVLVDKKYFSQEALSVFTESKNINTETLGPRLTKRELEILKLIANDKKTKIIAEILCISENTVETYRKNLRSKFKVSSMQAVIAKAYQTGTL